MVITLLVPTAVMAASSGSIGFAADVLPEVSITIDNSDAIDFGPIAVGFPTNWSREISISNSGTKGIDIDTDLLTTLGTDANFYYNCLWLTQWSGTAWGTEELANGWSVSVSPGSTVIVRVRLLATTGYVGSQTGTITFMATANE